LDSISAFHLIVSVLHEGGKRTVQVEREEPLPE